MENYKNRLIALCDRITDFFDWNLEKEQEDYEKNGKRRITKTEDLRKIVYKAKSEADINHGLGITGLYDRIFSEGYMAGWSELFGYSQVEDFNDERIEDQRKLAFIVKDIIHLYNEWKKSEFTPMIGDIASKLEAEKTDINPAILEAVNQLVMNGSFKAYKYRDGGDSISMNDEYHVSSVIGFSKDLTMWLAHVQNQQEFLSKQKENKVFITMFGKMDEVHPIYSNWVFTLHKGSTIWIVTDQVDFDNPYQKHARLGRRSVWRDRDEHYDDCDLPFDLFHDMEEMMGPNNKVAKNNSFIREPFVDFKVVQDEFGYFNLRDKPNEAEEMMQGLFIKKLEKFGIQYDHIKCVRASSTGFREYYIENMHARRDGHTVAYAHSGEIIIYKNPEVYFKDFSALKIGQQTFVILLMKEIIRYLGSNVEVERIMLASELIEQKLLIGARINPAVTNHMKYWTEENKAVFNEILETVEDNKKTTALTIKTYDIVKKSTHYNASWLSTPNKLESLSEWTILEDERIKLYPVIKKLENERENAYKWLYDQFILNYEDIVKRLTIAREIQFVGEIVKSSFDVKYKYGHCGRVVEAKKDKIMKKGGGIGKLGYKEEPCIMCERCTTKSVANKSRIVKNIHIRHYKELMWLLGYSDRKQLHKYFRQFRAHNMIPYTGNSSLDQTHPYLRIHDPCSRREPNGMNFDLFMCGTCYNKIKQVGELKIDWNGNIFSGTVEKNNPGIRITH